MFYIIEEKKLFKLFDFYYMVELVIWEEEELGFKLFINKDFFIISYVLEYIIYLEYVVRYVVFVYIIFLYI